jgi:hypothetical protein
VQYAGLLLHPSTKTWSPRQKKSVEECIDHWRSDSPAPSLRRNAAAAVRLVATRAACRRAARTSLRCHGPKRSSEQRKAQSRPIISFFNLPLFFSSSLRQSGGHRPPADGAERLPCQFPSSPVCHSTGKAVELYARGPWPSSGILHGCRIGELHMAVGLEKGARVGRRGSEGEEEDAVELRRRMGAEAYAGKSEVGWRRCRRTRRGDRWEERERFSRRCGFAICGREALQRDGAVGV